MQAAASSFVRQISSSAKKLRPRASQPISDARSSHGAGRYRSGQTGRTCTKSAGLRTSLVRIQPLPTIFFFARKLACARGFGRAISFTNLRHQDADSSFTHLSMIKFITGNHYWSRNALLLLRRIPCWVTRGGLSHGHTTTSPLPERTGTWCIMPSLLRWGEHAQDQSPVSPDEANLIAGAKVYQQFGCMGCPAAQELMVN